MEKITISKILRMPRADIAKPFPGKHPIHLLIRTGNEEVLYKGKPAKVAFRIARKYLKGARNRTVSVIEHDKGGTTLQLLLWVWENAEITETGRALGQYHPLGFNRLCWDSSWKLFRYKGRPFYWDSIASEDRFDLDQERVLEAWLNLPKLETQSSKKRSQRELPF